ncbi:hypothetical protein BH160DRAFT_3857 [Burkholderia sp. H160]|nr:hypothetical protein BH160DRAFT_3857 [Burkholderia sp. H160]
MGIKELLIKEASAEVRTVDSHLAGIVKPPKILSIGGCVTEVTCLQLNRFADVSHLWRVTIPCLMSKKIEGRSYFASKSPQLSERINFELTKQALHKIKTGGYEFVMFDPTSDYTNDYFEKDGCIISDMTQILAQGWEWPEGFMEDGWTRISPRSHRYLEMYVHYLQAFIDLCEELGLPLIILRRRACANKITAEGTTGLGDPDSAEINWWVDLLWKRIAGLTHKLNVLDINERFSITSFDVPYGEGIFHPIEEFYDYVAYKLMYMMRFSDDLIVETMFHSYKDRASRRRAVRQECDGLMQERDSLIQERDALRLSIEQLEGDLAQRSREFDSVCESRNSLESELVKCGRAYEEVCLEKAKLAGELQCVNEAHKGAARQYNDLLGWRNQFFEELRLNNDEGPMALRDVLPLARALRPVIHTIGRVKRAFKFAPR